MSTRQIEVHVDLMGTVHRVGTLWAQAIRGKDKAAFEYDSAWLDNPMRFSLEPALKVGEGQFVPNDQRAMFSSIGDSAPDTWGRRLMQRAERCQAKKDGRTVRTLMEPDYLLGVADVARLGALRFRELGEEFMSPLRLPVVPAFVELPRLLSVTQRVLRNEETHEDILLLFAPGSSLGGARPKASIRDMEGRLAIAKFPKDDDDYSIERWEAIAMDMAAAAGIAVAEHDLIHVAGRPILLSRRFDRVYPDGPAGDPWRTPFLSALALLNMRDGERSSYPDIVDALQQEGARAAADAMELFRRMVFGVLVSNVDDHLRNHGFLWTGPDGWTLSPAYDLNPVPQDVRPRILSTNISLDDGTCSLDLVRESAEYFDLSLLDADLIIHEVALVVREWRSAAIHRGAPGHEIQRLESAFEHEDLALALKNRTTVQVIAAPKNEPDDNAGSPFAPS